MSEPRRKSTRKRRPVQRYGSSGAAPNRGHRKGSARAAGSRGKGRGKRASAAPQQDEPQAARYAISSVVPAEKVRVTRHRLDAEDGEEYQPPEQEQAPSEGPPEAESTPVPASRAKPRSGPTKKEQRVAKRKQRQKEKKFETQDLDTRVAEIRAQLRQLPPTQPCVAAGWKRAHG